MGVRACQEDSPCRCLTRGCCGRPCERR
jgi:hypothetical protein